MRHAAALKAGAAYFATVFAAGFALATIRVLVVIPHVGETTAVLIELPIILAVACLSSSWLVERFNVPAGIAARANMGGLAFALLMLAEVGVSTLLFGRPLAGFLAQYVELSALLGLAGQLAFAAIPSIQLAVRR